MKLEEVHAADRRILTNYDEDYIFPPKDKEGTDNSVIWNHHNPYPNNLGRATRTPAIATNLHEHGKWKGQREIEDVVPPYEDIDGAARVWSVTPSKGKERERKGRGKQRWEAAEVGRRRRRRRRRRRVVPATAQQSHPAVPLSPLRASGQRETDGERGGSQEKNLEWEAGASYIFSGWGPDEKLQKLGRATVTTKSYKKLILTEAAINNLGHTMTDRTVVGISGDVNGAPGGGASRACLR